MSHLKPLLERMVRHDAQNGQAIVLVALFMLVLLGMLGLAIDGGGLFLLYRDARNAADTAALQAAYARCTSPAGSNEYKTTGLTAADENGFRNGFVSTVEIKDYGDVTGNAVDSGKTYVLIAATKPSYFAQIVFSGPLTIEVESVAFCDRGYNPETDGAGAIARGDDGVCGGNGAGQEFSFTGNELYFDGDITSAGSIGQSVKVWLQEGSRIHYYAGLKDSQAWRIAQSKDDMGNGSLPLATKGIAGSGINPDDYDIFDLDSTDLETPLSPGETLSLADYAPGGAVYDYLAANGGIVAYVPGGIGSVADIQAVNPNIIDANGFIQGLIVSDGDITLNGNGFNNYAPDVTNTYYYTSDGNDWDYTDFEDAFTGQNGDADWKGVSFISTGGEIKVKLTGTFARYYEGLDGLSGSEGLADEIGSDYAAIIMGSGNVNLTCSNRDKSISFGNKAYVYGFVWAASGRIDLSFADSDFRGGTDAYTVSYSGSSSRWWYDPTLLPSRGPSVGQES